MAAVTVKRGGTGDVISFDTVAEVGSAAEFISYIEKVWGEGVLLKPSSTSAFTARTPEPFPQGIYTFLPKPGTAVNTTLHNSCQLHTAQFLWGPLCQSSSSCMALNVAGTAAVGYRQHDTCWHANC